MPEEVRQVQFRVRGNKACFSRPELKVERVSYEVMTPSAARGLIENVLWKPEMYYEIRAISVLNPIKIIEFRRNEVKGRAQLGKHDFYTEDERTQRNTVALKNVDYVVTAVIGLTQPIGARASLDKYEDMFYKRVSAGQCIRHPWLGCREFDAYVSLAPAEYSTFDERRVRQLGFMHYDHDYRFSPPLPLVFKAVLDRGTVHIPSRAAVLDFNNTDGGPSLSRQGGR